MRRRRVDSKLERQFLIAMLTSRPFLATAITVLDVNLFQTSYIRQVAQWTVDHYRTYNDAPGVSIEPIFHAWAEAGEREEDDVNAIQDLLGQLSAESDVGDRINVAYLLDELSTYLSLRKLTLLNDSLTVALSRADKDAALQEVGSFRAVDLGQGCGFDPLTDRTAWTRAFADPTDPLVDFPGDAGRFLNHIMTRDALIALQGPEKRGKTMWCLEFVIRALRARRTVALFEVGDMSESQIMRRLGVRLTGMPMWRKQCGEMPVPVVISKLAEGEQTEDGLLVRAEYRVKQCPHPVGRRESIQASRRFLRGLGLRESPVRFSIHPNSSINVMEIDSILERWRQEQEFIPDVVVIDYPDILAPENGRLEYRHQVNETWKALRRLSQERHCLVVAPTQATRESYEATTQSMKHASEDKRKIAHVTGMLGLNQTSAEYKVGIMRLNWVALREDEFSAKRCLHVGQCLPLARACCCSVL